MNAVRLIPMLAVLACSESVNMPASGTTTRDSAGVTIVESALPDSGARPALRIADSPSVVIGALEGEDPYVFSGIAAARRLGDGRIVVADRRALELRFFDSRGRFIRSVGRSGEGPGEFRAVSLLIVGKDDSLTVVDGSGRRVTVLSPDGTVVGMTPIPRPALSLGPTFVGRLADGRLLGETRRMLMGAAAGVVRDSATFVALDSHRSGLDSIARLFRSNSLIEHLPENTISQGVLLFGGTAVAATDGDGFHHSNPEAYEISYYGADGALRRITRLLREPQPVTSAELDAYRARSTRRSGRSRADTPARVHATLDMLIVDGAGRLWAHEAARDAQTATPWRVFDDHGSLLGSVMIPATCRPMDIGADYLLCARTGAGEEPQVALHSMSPP